MTVRAIPPDTWRAMVDALRGNPPAPLPTRPGRMHRLPPIPDTDELADRWDDQHVTLTTHESTT